MRYAPTDAEPNRHVPDLGDSKTHETLSTELSTRKNQTRVAILLCHARSLSGSRFDFGRFSNLGLDTAALIALYAKISPDRKRDRLDCRSCGLTRSCQRAQNAQALNR